MNSKFQKPRPGLAFKNGKFYDFDTRRIVVVRAWPEPMAWFRTPTWPWKGTRKWADKTLIGCFRGMENTAQHPGPLDQYSLPPGTADNLRADGCSPEFIEESRVTFWQTQEGEWKNQVTCIRPFIEQIPPEIRTIIAPLSYRAWHLLTLFARCPGSLDLYHSNPALAYALSGHWLYREHKVSNPLRAARRLVYKRQREILSWMGFPGTKSVQRIFQKIAITTLHPAALRSMKAALLDPARHKVLAHLPVITPDVLNLVLHEEHFRHVGMRFILEMLEDPNGARAWRRLLRDTLLMDQQRGGGHIPAPFNSIRRMREVHADLVTLTNNVLLTRDMNFPDPPYAGTEEFQPVRTLRDLVNEGIQMRHCVASHADRVAGGSYYIYRILKPVRATMAISWYDGRWHCSELQGVANLAVGCRHREFIVDSFFSDTCLRGPVKSVPDPYEEEPALDVLAEPASLHDADPPPPWVPCDRNGHPLLLVPDESRLAVAKIREVFAGGQVA